MKDLQDYKELYESSNIKKNLTGEDALEAVTKDGLDLCYVSEQTPEICLVAVKNDGYALKHVRTQTVEICLAAVKKTGCAIQYVKEQTPEICLAALDNDNRAIVLVDSKFFEEKPIVAYMKNESEEDFLK